MGKKKKGNRNKKRPIVWSAEQMEHIMGLRRSNASAKHRSKKAYRRRNKYRGEDG